MLRGDGRVPHSGPEPREPAQREPLDDRGRLQETEPYAALSVRLLPAASVLILLVGGALGVIALTSGMTGAGVTWLVITLVLVTSCWFGFVQARRARRSDRMRDQRGE